MTINNRFIFPKRANAKLLPLILLGGLTGDRIET